MKVKHEFMFYVICICFTLVFFRNKCLSSQILFLITCCCWRGGGLCPNGGEACVGGGLLSPPVRAGGGLVSGGGLMSWNHPKLLFNKSDK